MNSSRMRLLGDVSFMGDKKNAYWYLVGNDGDQLEDQDDRWEDSTNTYLTEIVW